MKWTRNSVPRDYKLHISPRKLVISTFRQSEIKYLLAFSSATSLEKACSVVQSPSLTHPGVARQLIEVQTQETEMNRLLWSGSRGWAIREGWVPRAPMAACRGLQGWFISFNRLWLMQQACSLVHMLMCIYVLRTENSLHFHMGMSISPQALGMGLDLCNCKWANRRHVAACMGTWAFYLSLLIHGLCTLSLLPPCSGSGVQANGRISWGWRSSV